MNNDLLPNCTLEPGFPRQIARESSRKWLHHLGFHYLTLKKGSFVDGHERADVVEHRKLFLRKLVSLGFLRKEHAPTTESAASEFPVDVEELPKEIYAKQ